MYIYRMTKILPDTAGSSSNRSVLADTVRTPPSRPTRDVELVTDSEATHPPHTFLVFEDRAGTWQWRLFAPDGKVLTDSFAAFASPASAAAAAFAQRAKRGLAGLEQRAR